MRVAIMQPYWFPYLGYYQLAACADRFVYFDDVNFIKKGWINRNRILNNGQELMLTVPLSEVSQNKRINETRIAHDGKWPAKLEASLRHAYGKSKHFAEVMPVVSGVHTVDHADVSRLAAASIGNVLQAMGNVTGLSFSSELAIPPEIMGQDRIIALCKAMGATEYVNPANGMSLYDARRFAEAGIRLRFLRMRPVPYPQAGSATFVPFLSMLDVLFNVGFAGAAALLPEYDLLDPEDTV